MKTDIKLTPIIRGNYFLFLDEVTGEIFEPTVEVMNLIETVYLQRAFFEDEALQNNE